MAAGALWFVHWSSQPAQTTIHVADASMPAAKLQPSYQPLRSKLFASEVPYGWVIHVTTDTAALTQITSFPNGSSLDSGQIAVTIDSLPPSGLSGVPDFNLRKTTPETYETQTTSLPGVSVLFLDKNTTSAYTAFLLHGGRYATVSASQFDTLPEAYAMLKHVIEMWKWSP
jgi:hypothetical protein